MPAGRKVKKEKVKKEKVKKRLQKCFSGAILLLQTKDPRGYITRACTGFDGGLAAGEAIRRRCVKSQT